MIKKSFVCKWIDNLAISVRIDYGWLFYFWLYLIFTPLAKHYLFHGFDPTSSGSLKVDSVSSGDEFRYFGFDLMIFERTIVQLIDTHNISYFVTNLFRNLLGTLNFYETPTFTMFQV